MTQQREGLTRGTKPLRGEKGRSPGGDGLQ